MVVNTAMPIKIKRQEVEKIEKDDFEASNFKKKEEIVEVEPRVITDPNPTPLPVLPEKVAKKLQKELEKRCCPPVVTTRDRVEHDMDLIFGGFLLGTATTSLIFLAYLLVKG